MNTLSYEQLENQWLQALNMENCNKDVDNNGCDVETVDDEEYIPMGDNNGGSDESDDKISVFPWMTIDLLVI